MVDHLNYLFVVELLQYILNVVSFNLGNIVLDFMGYLVGHGILKIYLDKTNKEKENFLPGTFCIKYSIKSNHKN